MEMYRDRKLITNIQMMIPVYRVIFSNATEHMEISSLLQIISNNRIEATMTNAHSGLNNLYRATSKAQPSCKLRKHCLCVK